MGRYSHQGLLVQHVGVFRHRIDSIGPRSRQSCDITDLHDVPEHLVGHGPPVLSIVDSFLSMEIVVSLLFNPPVGARRVLHVVVQRRVARSHDHRS